MCPGVLTIEHLPQEATMVRKIDIADQPCFRGDEQAA